MPYTKDFRVTSGRPVSTGWGGRFRSIDPVGTSEPTERIIYQNFETGSIAPLTIKGTDSVAIVESSPFTGTKCLRGNLAGGLTVTDPLTGKPPNSNPLDLAISSLTSNASRTWSGVYMRYRLRFDDADNRQEDGNVTRPKLGYLSDLRNDATSGNITVTQSAIFPTITAGCGFYSLYRNGIGDTDPTPDWPETSISLNDTQRGMSYDGEWNLVEIWFDNHRKTISFWCNGIKVLSDNGQAFADRNGNFPVRNTYTFDHFSFFHGSAHIWANSTNRTGVAGGFQIDELEVWRGNPKGVINGYV